MLKSSPLKLREWDERYRSGEQVFDTPVPLVVNVAQGIKPGAALDLACGAGRNAIYLAERGWRVTAVDGAPSAIKIVQDRAAERGVDVDVRIANLQRGDFVMEPAAYDLICACYYLQRDLFPAMKAGVRPGGVVISIVHLADPGEPRGAPKRAYPGELRTFFEGWRILHDYEGEPRESCHKRAVAEIAAERPG